MRGDDSGAGFGIYEQNHLNLIRGRKKKLKSERNCVSIMTHRESLILLTTTPPALIIQYMTTHLTTPKAKIHILMVK